ncbi:GAF domain-containing SpoIIE family protein phosphatase [Streptomyces parvulus]|uniref:GAF domain-containing protein n=1 Tax=Streptomyces parvulus TaxID=146923 RepID=A0A369V259_9ACTN|nr:SpoIIE family protein phosphatase [Streptomyces parvulus]RDD87074.1 GAF domain-containing protein [Streptomyces parvulus]
MASPEDELVGDGDRLQAVRETGLTAVADADMDRFARLVSRVLGVPVALVSMLEEARQVFPGMVGLGEPWARTRQTPLSHALCHHVVASGEPFTVADTRADERTAASPAIDALGVLGYAGVPLTDDAGRVLGSLCAVDTRPRRWSAEDLAALRDLAAACSAELRLRIASSQRELARQGEARARERADVMQQRTRTALKRSQLLLRAADALADTTGLNEVRRRVRELVSGDLKPHYVGLVLAERRRMRRLIDRTGLAPVEYTYETYSIDSAWPTARAAREKRTVIVRSPEELADQYGPDAVAAFGRLGLHTAVCVPLPGSVNSLGTLVLGWAHPHEVDVLEQAVLASLAGYTARAVERALFVDDRVHVAHQLQEAMLTDLPTVDGLDTAALYRPAAQADMVGGDWYDLYVLPPAPGRGEEPATVALTIGDITGHDMHAATLMGQTRSMLRQADLDHPGEDPAHIVQALEHANRELSVGSSGTLVHTHLRLCPPPDAAAWELTWTNAGHPPPLLALPDGTTELLHDHGALVHPSLDPSRRTSHRRVLAPGTLLLLYTDGLVERRGTDLDALTDRAARTLATHRRDDLPALLSHLVDTVAGPTAPDDIALLAVRVKE